MKVMKEKILLVLLLPAFILSLTSKAQEIEEITEVVNVLPDTIIRTDTIVIREVITRTDIVHRTEQVVRYEEKTTGSSQNLISGQEDDNSSVLITESTQIINGARADRPSREPMIIHEVDTVYVERTSNWNDKSERYHPIDPNEKVTFRGDTLPMVLRDRNLGRFDRGLFNFLFIPKGIWQIGLTASYGEFSTEDLEVLDLISDIDFSGKIFSVRPYFSYFIKNNVSVGMRLGYTYGKADISSFNVDIDEDMSFNLHDIMYRSTSYTGALTFNQYFGIARRGRFGVFNEVELAFSGGSSDFHRPFDGEMRKTRTSTFETALNFSPGLCVYMLDQISFNVSFGVFGLYVKHEKQKENGENIGSRTTSGANFRFNIFNINFGIAVNI